MLSNELSILVDLNWGQFGPSGKSLQHQETFLVVTNVKVLLASSGQKPVLLCPGQPSMAQNYLTQNASSMKAEKPWPRMFSSLHLILGPAYYLIHVLKVPDYCSILLLNKFEISLLPSSIKNGAILCM